MFPVLFIVSFFLFIFQEEPEDHDELSSERLRSKPNGEFAVCENLLKFRFKITFFSSGNFLIMKMRFEKLLNVCCSY